ncbi:hypothetical protein MMC07_000310 [Pseudocyphellaria aurata]|nr:hypothetical protein [Pseudocyphellaria aurata]
MSVARMRHSHGAFHRERMSSPLDYIIAQLPKLSKRDSSESSSTSSNVCAKDDKSVQCAKPADSNNITIPVVLGIVIPLVAAIVIFFLLHRRHVKKLRLEDANDPHKSLDFGMDTSNIQTAGKKNGNKDNSEAPMVDLGVEKSLRRERGMSIDMGSPYLLPPGLQSSRESLHSLSRTVHNNGDDRYRPATTLISDESSTHTYPKAQGMTDDSSSYTGSGISGRGYGNDSMNQTLLANAQSMSRSVPPTQLSPLMDKSNIPEIRTSETESQVTRKPSPAIETVSSLSPVAPLDTRDSYMGKESADLRKSNNYLGHLIHSREPSTDKPTEPQISASRKTAVGSSLASTLQHTASRKSPPPEISTTSEASRPPRKQSLKAPTEPIYQGKFLDNANDYAEAFSVTPPSLTPGSKEFQHNHMHKLDPDAKTLQDEYTLGGPETPVLGYDVRRLSMGFRPLPPDDPTDNPEQRANRIRSFYKEYFDDSRAGPAQAPAATYVEDYDQGYLGDGAVFDPTSGKFLVAQPQFSEPFTRRAMTPPPRAPPRFQGPPRHHATLSGGRFVQPGSRAFSSASGHFGPSGRGSPRKALPPPGPLRVLPSPHLLKEDSFALPIDFAPPNSYKDRQAGRPESPRGGMRPFSPMLPAHLPLASSFDDLSVMPSPHLLRKSGTFTGLDFAPPPRFKSNETASDAGSIRSNRSAMSAQQLQNIRAGAYRVSRIPKDVVGMKHEINDSLKPQWDMRAP